MTALQASQLMDPFRPDRPTLLQARGLFSVGVWSRAVTRRIFAPMRVTLWADSCYAFVKKTI